MSLKNRPEFGELEIKYTYSYSPMRMYARNGDPGSPEEEEIDFTARQDGKDISDQLDDGDIAEIEDAIREDAGEKYGIEREDDL